MKLLKAFVRRSRLDETLRCLEDAGAPGISISSVHGVGYGYHPSLFTLSPGELNKIPEVAKVEIVCEDSELSRLLDVLVQAARTGSQGDGIVFVTPVERAIRIRTGEEVAEPRRRS